MLCWLSCRLTRLSLPHAWEPGCRNCRVELQASVENLEKANLDPVDRAMERPVRITLDAEAGSTWVSRMPW